jgi:hypothetical protein
MTHEFEINPARRAAVVLGDGVAGAHLLFAFVYDLRARGFDVAGVLEDPKDELGCGPVAPRRLFDLATGERFAVCETLHLGRGCQPDPVAAERPLQMMAQWADSAHKPQLVVASGWERGQRVLWWRRLDEIAAAGGTVLTCLRRDEVEAWLAATGGIGTLLAARLAILHDWWRGIPSWRAAETRSPGLLDFLP